MTAAVDRASLRPVAAAVGCPPIRICPTGGTARCRSWGKNTEQLAVRFLRHHVAAPIGGG
jgi:hypothetical protein